ncbi:MAG TPA: cache domain-containing protein [Longimicrobiales bacterium]
MWNLRSCLMLPPTLAAVAVLLAADIVGAQQPAHRAADSPLTIDASIALHSLTVLGDMHLQKVADTYRLIASLPAVRSAEWQSIRMPLEEAARMNVAAIHWFALPDGTYWTVEQDEVAGNLADRPYFPRVLAGQTVIGELVVSRSTGRSTAIVAVPVYGDNETVVAVLGASIHLDSLSQRIREEMQLHPDQLFFSLDREPIVGLHTDPHVIFLHPLEEDDPELGRAIREMVSRDSGVATYAFRGRQRTVLYQRSAVTNWWYAFGIVHP